MITTVHLVVTFVLHVFFLQTDVANETLKKSCLRRVFLNFVYSLLFVF